MKNRKNATQIDTTTLPGSFVLELPPHIRRRAQELAEIDEISLEDFVAIAIAEKIAHIQTVQEPPDISVSRNKKLIPVA